MSAVFEILGIVHMGVAALIIAGYVLSLSSLRVHPVMVWAARVQLLLGIVLTGLGEAGGAQEKLNHAWVGGKFAIGMAVVACLEIAASKARKGETKPMLLHVALALTLVNIALAFLR